MFDPLGSAMAFSPRDGVLHLLLKPGASDAFMREALSFTDGCLSAGALTGVLANGRAASLFKIAFPDCFAESRVLTAYRYAGGEADCAALPGDIAVIPCKDAQPDAVRTLIQEVARADGVCMTEKESNDCVLRLAQDTNAFCLTKDGKTVSLARILESIFDTARIGWVSTLPAYRGNGFAALLTGYLGQSLQQHGLTAVMYAGSDNCDAARCYRKARFVPCGTLTRFSVRPVEPSP